MAAVNPKYVQELKTLIKNSPYPSHINMEIDHIDIDQAEIGMRLAECHMQPFGIVHGGALASLIDTATFWAVFLRLPEDTGLVNVDLKLNYLEPAFKGKLRGAGVCLRPGKSISYSQASVFDENNTLIAHGTSTLMALPGKGLRLKESKFLEE